MSWTFIRDTRVHKMTKMTRMIFQEWFKSILDCREQLKCFEGTEASDRLVMPIAFIIKIFSGQI